jgi:hypothetical protein
MTLGLLIMTKKEIKLVLLHGDFWKSLAQACGGDCKGFTHLYYASFTWPNGNTSEINRGMRDALMTLTGIEMPKEGIR